MRVDLETFEGMYAAEADPWAFASAPYEQRKYAITVASLPRFARAEGAVYRRCFEPGCSIGALTERLAVVAETVVARDASPSAIVQATERLASSENVDVARGVIPEDWPTGTFDLIVFSELGYYWNEAALRDVLDRLDASLDAAGDLVAVHWRGHSPDHILSGDTVHAVIREHFGVSVAHHSEPGFVLDVWSKG